MQRKYLAIAGLAVLAAATAVWYGTRSSAAPDQLRLYGNVDLRQVALAFSGSERITALHAEEGQRVRAGQVLGELDARTLQLRLAQVSAQAAAQEQALHRLQAGSRPEELAQAAAQSTAAAADAELAQQQLQRLQAIQSDSGGRAVSQQDVDNAQARHKTAQAQLERTRKAQLQLQNGPRREDLAQAGAQLEAARAEQALIAHQLAQTRLTAPIDAVVRARLLEPGDMASPQRPVFTLAITSPKWVRTYVKEADLGRIKPGMAATISIDSLPGSTLPGKIGYISSVAEFTPKTVQTEELRTALVYEVRVLADDQADRLRMGMPATVHIALAHDSRQP
jgi:HlyD family secretion protein